MAIQEKSFPKGGRNWRSSSDENNIGIYYQTNKTDYDRVRNKTYTDTSGQSLDGKDYAQEPVEGQYFILHSGYRKGSDGNWQYFTYPPGREVENGNLGQATIISRDKDLKAQLTQTQLPNTSTGQSSPDQQGGNTPTSEPGSTPVQTKGRGEPVTPGSGLRRYPAEMSVQQDKIKFYAVEIVPGGLTGEPKYSIKDGPIFLGIQGSISDQNSIDWGPDTVNSVDATIFNAAKNIIKGTYTPPTEKQIYDAFQGNKNYIQTYLAGQAASLNNVLARTDNVILNPNLELLFQGPQLRPFSFQFKMSARDEPEAENIKQIINFFKKNMAVRGKNELFLKAPYVFTIQYMRGSQTPHPSINKISKSNDEKACALTNCSVDYTPLGSYMTYDDPSGTMVSYTLSLQFQEITPIYQEDYDGHAIGY